MDEQIMVIDANWYNNSFGNNSSKIIQVKENDYFKSIESNCMFISRSSAEVDKKYKQIVSYCLLINEDDMFITRRTNKQTERRLHNRYSLGIGGHVNNIDTKSDSIIVSGMLRELSEEIDIQCGFKYQFLGIINDNSTEVNSVHTGVCFLINLKKKMCLVKEKEKMEGFWINKSRLIDYMNNLETWSKILLNSM